MTNKRAILIEASLVIGVLATGIAAASTARAATLSFAAQAAEASKPDPRTNVKIESIIQVERIEKDANGNDITKLYAPADVKVVPGDKLLFVNSYHNTGKEPVTGFVINNPVHPAVSFTEVSEDWAVVSIDGGKKFAKLTGLSVAEDRSASDSSEAGAESAPQEKVRRAAQPSDVTHIRWVFDQPIAAGASGKLTFRGVVK